MADKFISFSAPMIRALLEGRKTQTRRIIDIPQGFKGPSNQLSPEINFERNDNRMLFLVRAPGEHRWLKMRHAVGDRLWVKEAWQTFVSLDNLKPSEVWSKQQNRGAGIAYVAGGGLSITKGGLDYLYGDERHDILAFGKVRNIRFMPKWASRITLIVRHVRIQRLQDITGEDAIAEGATSRPSCCGEALDLPGWSMDWSQVKPEGPWENDIALATPQGAYMNYFYKVNHFARKHGDDPSLWPNPWVAAYTVSVIKENIERIAA